MCKMTVNSAKFPMLAQKKPISHTRYRLLYQIILKSKLEVVFLYPAYLTKQCSEYHRYKRGKNKADKQKSYITNGRYLDRREFEYSGDLVDYISGTHYLVRAFNADSRYKNADRIKKRDCKDYKVLSRKIVISFHGVYSSLSSDSISISFSVLTPSALVMRIADEFDLWR